MYTGPQGNDRLRIESAVAGCGGMTRGCVIIIREVYLGGRVMLPEPREEPSERPVETASGQLSPCDGEAYVGKGRQMIEVT